MVILTQVDFVFFVRKHFEVNEDINFNKEEIKRLEWVKMEEIKSFLNEKEKNVCLIKTRNK